MKLRQLFSRRRSAERSSLTGILPRVQKMRQSCEWEPVVTPEVIQERENRLSEARKSIAWHPQQFERTETAPEAGDETKRLTALIAIVLAAVSLICLSVELAVPQRNSLPGRPFTYRLESKPPFLSEPLAISKAWDALQESGVKKPDLEIMARPNNAMAAPNGRWDEYLLRTSPIMGVLEFQRQDGRESYQVSVSLQGSSLACVISTNRPASTSHKRR